MYPRAEPVYPRCGFRGTLAPSTSLAVDRRPWTSGGPAVTRRRDPPRRPAPVLRLPECVPIRRLVFVVACALGAALTPGTGATAQAPRGAGPRTLIPVEQYRLANGMKVVLHVDRSDPVVAVSLNAHVGSSREVPGRTGFAHLFEHLFFLESENLGKGGLDRMTARIGGSGANGSTSRDITDYLQTVPKDALEKMIWAEADKIGFFINTVTEPVLAKEKQVVKNEKRQSVDNQPYGHTGAVVAEHLYPAGHPYSWSVIGSLADLDAASWTTSSSSTAAGTCRTTWPS
jgi:zinc protease